MKSSNKPSIRPNYTIDPNMKSYSDSPFVKKKMDKAIAILSSLKNPLKVEQ